MDPVTAVTATKATIDTAKALWDLVKSGRSILKKHDVDEEIQNLFDNISDAARDVKDENHDLRDAIYDLEKKLRDANEKLEFKESLKWEHGRIHTYMNGDQKMYICPSCEPTTVNCQEEHDDNGHFAVRCPKCSHYTEIEEGSGSRSSSFSMGGVVDY